MFLGASFSSFGCLVFEFWVLRFRDLGVFVFDLGCFVFEFWVLSFRSRVLRFRDLGVLVFVFECFVFETTSYTSVVVINVWLCLTGNVLIMEIQKSIMVVWQHDVLKSLWR